LKLTEIADRTSYSPDGGARAVRPPQEGGPDERSIVTASPTRIATAQDLGDLVREERELRKLSQQAFADLVGVGRRFISELENGKATLEFDKVVGVASAIGIDLVARKR
jgi:HTH-type transcriptional regulator/antitoxin HipB